MSRIESSKIVAYAASGVDGAIQVSKLVVYVLLTPGDGDDDSNRQGHVHTRIIRRA